MSVRTFVSCARRNPQRLRYVEQQRTRRGDRGGRRVTDGLAWFDGSLEEAVLSGGWRVGAEGRQLCARCAALGPAARAGHRMTRAPGVDRRDGR